MAHLLIDDEAWCEADFRPLSGTKKEHPGGMHKHESWEWISALRERGSAFSRSIAKSLKSLAFAATLLR
jgi:hypothetical protein